MKPEDCFMVLLGVCVITLTVSILYGISQDRAIPDEITKDISGIVIHRDEQTVWVRLTSPDYINKISKGEIQQYNLTDINSETRNGDYIEGSLVSKNSLLVKEVYDFFDREGSRGFVNKGDLVLISGGKITWDHSAPYPSFKIEVKNLGEKDIVGIRASINGVQLPYTFEVTKRNPLQPSQTLNTNRYTAWYDPEKDDIAGYIPEEGDEYNVEFLVKYKNLRIQEYNKASIFERPKIASISTICGFERVFFEGGDLLSLGRGKGGSVYVYFRNSWWLDSAQTINILKISINGETVMNEDVHIQMAEYVAYCARIPFDIEAGEEYTVTLTAISTDGNISEYTKTVTCEYYLLR